MARILLLEDEESVRFSVRRALERDGHEVDEFQSVTAALDHTRQAAVDAVLTDVNLGEQTDGVEFAKTIRAEGFAGPIIVMTGYGSVEQAVDAMKHGVDDYLQKPVVLQEVVLLVSRLLDASKLRSRLRLYERLDAARAAEEGVLGESKAWKETLGLAQRLASLPIPDRVGSGESLPTVLILGETGTGKGVLARHIHDCAQGDDDNEPFVQVNCTALPPTLIEAELFGHEKGAFTDAKAAREGLFEMADGGTIFLDEIGDMPADLQAKILTVVEEGRYRRVGGTKEQRVRARVLAATNCDLETKMKDGSFRPDLYYRLSSFTVRIPSLREREDDAVIIAKRILARQARQYGREDLSLTDHAEDAIAAHDWPGNVRELINVIQRAALLAKAEDVTEHDLGLADAPTNAPSGGTLPAAAPGEVRFDFSSGECTAENVERELIVQALRHTNGNVSKAARVLRMQRSSLRYRIERFELDELVKELVNK